MIKACPSRRSLQMWFDGEKKDTDLDVHIQTCRVCRQEVETWSAWSECLEQSIQAQVAGVEPLEALQKIRQCIAHQDRESIFKRGVRRLQVLWFGHKRLALGIALSVILGIVSVPISDYASTKETSDEVPLASVVVESLEVEGNAEAVVYRPEGGSTTVIWTQADDEVYRFDAD
jgi:hypothetical protein